MKKILFIFIILILLFTTSCRTNLEDIKLNDVYFDLEKNTSIDKLEEILLYGYNYEKIDYEANNNQDIHLIFDMKLPNGTSIDYFMINGAKVKNYEYINNKYYINFNTKDYYNFLTYHIDYVRYKNNKGYSDYKIDKKFSINILDNNIKNDAKISNLNIDYTNINFDLEVNDRYRKPNFENIYFYENYNIFDIKNIKKNKINCNFESLNPDTSYDYIVISNYDLGDGNLGQYHELLRGTINTKKGYVNDNKITPNNVLYIGNSLIKGFTDFGLAANNINEDIYYNLNKKIEELNPNYNSKRINLSNAESINYLEELKIIENLDYNPDLVFIFLGDNFNYEAEGLDEMAKMLIYLIKLKNRNARIYWIGGWYWSPQKSKKLLPVLEYNKVEYINIFDLRNKENSASINDIINLEKEITYEMEYESYEFNNGILNINYKFEDKLYDSIIECSNVIKNNNILKITSNKYIIHSYDVATHPSSIGMKKISDRIIEKLKWN